jgi:ABC-type uncharacterized transport system substrate-binding protein
MKKYFILFVFSIFCLSMFNSCSKKQETTKDGKKIYKVAIGYFGPDVSTNILIQDFINGMGELGYKEGDNLIIKKFHAGGEMANIPQQFQAADNDGNDLIVVLTTPCISAAATVVKKTKMVFVFVTDALAAGIGKSFTEHMPNLTGIQSFPPLDETISMMREFLPGLTTIATIYNPGEANSRVVIDSVRPIIKRYGLTLKEFNVSSTNDIAQSAQAASNSGAQVIWISGDNTVLQSFEGVLKLANAKNIPVFVDDIEFLKKGAIAAIGIRLDDIAKATAKYADRILKGENPKDIPIINVSNTDVEVNYSVAKKLNINIPAKFLNK